MSDLFYIRIYMFVPILGSPHLFHFTWLNFLSSFSIVTFLSVLYQYQEHIERIPPQIYNLK